MADYDETGRRTRTIVVDYVGAHDQRLVADAISLEEGVAFSNGKHGARARTMTRKTGMARMCGSSLHPAPWACARHLAVRILVRFHDGLPRRMRRPGGDLGYNDDYCDYQSWSPRTASGGRPA